MKKKLIFTLLFLSLAGTFENAWATSNPHDFRPQIWAKGRSCAICHVIIKGLPSLTPPGARLTVDNASLSPLETQAVGIHASNRLCYVCHNTNQDANSHSGSSTTTSTNGNLPYNVPTGPALPTSVGQGTYGSICVRINNQGAKGLDCLSCHDVHNMNSSHLLRADFGLPVLK